MHNVIPFKYEGLDIRFNTEGWINATDIAKQFGKRPADWLKQEEVKEYLSVLADALNCDPESLLKTQRGRYDGGTWLHPKLGVRFAQWLDTRFAVWCDLHIDGLLRGEISLKQQFEKASAELEAGREVASLSGKGLAAWRWQKGALEARAEYWRQQLQMQLPLH
ncbi:DNA-binding protein [Vreelandella aquamarina]|jgi:hypothetical protein|uniref:ORF11CD3 domain-containing protein n=1 Tax=Vreelandella aquamarina TaxID=77097 RepID=A0A1N6DN63_9GAMM|nr:KilA-N domain-containing protein [Halomonas meridiana]GED45267.1 DNA-binding protein [Halomonas meridiana]SIN62280.1 ORF11CD3 domain-containing protein [Halomonas meridiana]SIN72157.1 ORF11CD3 domain-containing protein [Halomonas meridiana]SIO21598.1 ORF11CD3 domain-containing protein [Halomonas meridiana]